MNKLISTFLLSILAIVSSCKNKDEFVLYGKIENAGGIKRVLLYDTNHLIDSAFLNENSEFKFIHREPEPDFYSIVIDSKSFLFIAKNGDDLTFSTDFANKKSLYKIEGSEESDKIRQFNTIYNRYAGVIRAAQARITSLEVTDPEALDSLNNLITENKKMLSTEALKFAGENKNNLAGLYAASTVDRYEYERELISYAEEIKDIYPGNRSVRSFVTAMLALKPVSVGQTAPDFELPDANGKLIKLSDYKGKYLLLDFWASWCPPCRVENPDIVKQYNAFKNKGFSVLGVSLDDNKDSWLRAVKDDHLAWNHVSELKSWNERWDGKVTTLYKIDAIPASFILDPEGRIVAKNLKGKDLEDFLNKVLK